MTEKTKPSPKGPKAAEPKQAQAKPNIDSAPEQQYQQAPQAEPYTQQQYQQVPPQPDQYQQYAQPQYQQPYVQPQYAVQAPQNPGETAGIIGIVLNFLGIRIGGIIAGVISRNKSREVGAPTTLGTVSLVWGLVVTGLAVLTGLVLLIIFIIAAASA